MWVGDEAGGEPGDPEAGEVGREVDASGTERREGVRRPVRVVWRGRPMLLVLLERVCGGLLFSRDMAAELLRRSRGVREEVRGGWEAEDVRDMGVELEGERSIGGGSGGGMVGGSSPELVEIGKSGIWRMCSVSIKA